MLCFWNDGSPRLIKNTRRVKMPNGDVVMNARPDPDNDLYEYVETGPKAGRFQAQGPTTYENDGWTVTATRTVSDNPLAGVQARLVAAAKQTAGNLLSKDDWQTIRELEEPGKPMAQEIKAYRKAVRDAVDAYEVAVLAAVDNAEAFAVELVLPVDPREAV